MDDVPQSTNPAACYRGSRTTNLQKTLMASNRNIKILCSYTKHVCGCGFCVVLFFLDIGHYLVVLQDQVNEALCSSFQHELYITHLAFLFPFGV